MYIDRFPSPMLMAIIFRDEEGFDEVEVVVAGRNSVKVGGKGERAEKLFLHYAQRSTSLSDLLLITIPSNWSNFFES